MNFSPKSEENQKQLPFVAMFSQPNSNEDENKKVFFDDFIDCDLFNLRYLIVSLYDICFFCAIFDRHIRMKIKQITVEEKRYFPLTLYGGTLNFPLWGAKSQWEDANYRWEDASLLQLKYWLYFHSQVMALFHYCDSATLRNQHQLLKCKTSKWQSLLF